MNQVTSFFCVIGAVLTLTGVTTAGTKRGNTSSVPFPTRFQCSGQIKCYCSSKEVIPPNNHWDTKPASGYVSPYGLTHEAPRIVGGIVAMPHSHPHQVSLQKRLGDSIWVHFCGGSIVKSDIILTAAHCLDDIDLDRFRVVAGAHSIFYNEPTQQKSRVHSVYRHPKNDKKLYDYDYGIVRLIVPLTFDSSVKPIKLAEEEPIEGNCTVTGWGCTSRICQDIRPDLLMEVHVPFLNRSTCISKYTDPKSRCRTKQNMKKVTEHMICAGSTNKGTCNGDTGGPLVCGGKLAGIDSWGEFPCVQKYCPGVFASVAKERKWIEEQ